jgi:hypothetical protein
MSNFEALKQALAQCEANIGKLTASQMENAMNHMDMMAPSFGRGSVFFRTIDRVEGNQSLLAPVTQEQFAAYLANKREMLANHNYL